MHSLHFVQTSKPSLLGRIRSVAGNGDGETVCEGVEEKSAEVTNHCFLEYQIIDNSKTSYKICT